MGKIQKIREQKKIEEQLYEDKKSEKNKKTIKWIAAGIGGLLIVIYGIYLFSSSKEAKAPVESQQPSPSTITDTDETPIASIFPQVNQSPSTMNQNSQTQKYAQIETEKGVIKLELFSQDAPKTVANFVNLANKGFYNGLKFHRVVPDFVIQGGDPLGTGAGGPGYSFEDEINPQSLGLPESVIKSYEANGYKYRSDLQSHKMTIGALAMANSGPNTNGSQFFIVTTQDQPYLDGKHTVFGKVIEGMDIVKKIQQGDVMKKISVGE